MGEDIPTILPPYHPLTEMYPQTAERTDPCSVTEPKPNQWTKPTNSLFFLLHVVLRNILYFYIRYNIQFGLISQNKKRGRHTINILLHHAVLACKGWPWLSIQEYYISYPLYKKKLYILSKKKSIRDGSTLQNADIVSFHVLSRSGSSRKLLQQIFVSD